MTKTVTSLFHSAQHAADAANRLAQAGIPRDAIDIWSTPHNLAPLLEDLGVSRADAYAYAEGVARGGSVVIVKCNGEAVGRVVGILDQEGVLDLDEQQASWRTQGWQEAAAGPGSSPAPIFRAGEGYDLTGSPDMTPAQTDVTPASWPDEEGHGRVRIHARNPERPTRE